MYDCMWAYIWMHIYEYYRWKMVYKLNVFLHIDWFTEKQISDSNEGKYLKEAAALEKLVMPLEIRKTVDSSMVQNRNPMKVPDNNPFKKMKCGEIQLDQIESMTEQVSVAIDVENFDILCVTPYSSTPLEVLDKSSRKRRAQEYSLRSDSMNKFQV